MGCCQDADMRLDHVSYAAGPEGLDATSRGWLPRSASSWSTGACTLASEPAIACCR